jgi:hypothetical protein
MFHDLEHVDKAFRPQGDLLHYFGFRSHIMTFVAAKQRTVRAYFDLVFDTNVLQLLVVLYAHGSPLFGHSDKREIFGEL